VVRFGFVAKHRAASSFAMTKIVICLREQWKPVRIVVPVIPFVIDEIRVGDVNLIAG
jgi:hypothetical protein